MKIGRKQREWIENLRSDDPFYTDEIRSLVAKHIFGREDLTEKQMANMLIEKPEKYFVQSA